MTTNALQAVLDKAAQHPAPDKIPTRELAAEAVTPQRKRRLARASENLPEAGGPSRHARPVRDGKRFVGAHFHPEVARQLKMLAAEDNTTIQELLEQAVDLLFVKNGRTKIADLVRKGRCV